MPGRRFAQRLPGATHADFARMAWAPSRLAPHPAEVLTPALAPADGRGLPLPELLAKWTARDLEWDGERLVGLSLSGRAFLAGGGELLDAVPRLRSVRLVAIQPFMGELAACPHLARLEALSLWGNQIGDAGAVALAGSPHVGGLRALDLSRNGLTDAGARALADSPTLVPACALKLAENPGISPLGWAALRARFGTIPG